MRERENIRALVSAYLDGELAPDEALYVARMIHEDSRFARTYEAYRSIRTSIRALPRPDVPPAVSAGVRSYTAAHPVVRPAVPLRTRVAQFVAAATALVVTLVTIFTGAFGLTPRPTTGPYAPNATVVSAPATVVALAPQTFATPLKQDLQYNEQIEIRFSSPMDENTLLNTVTFNPGIPTGNLRYTDATRILSTIPNTLRPDTDYRVSIPKGLLDRQGAEVRPDTFDFSVGPAPAAILPTAMPTAIPTATPAATPAVTVVAAVVPTEEPEATATVAVATTRPVATTATVATVATPGVSRPVATATFAPVATPDEGNAAATATAPRMVVVASTATITPRPPTATTAPIRATATAPAPAATATPVPRPTNTTAPTVAPTATPVPTPAATATPVPPAIPVSGRFTGAYAQTANRLGEPVSAASMASGTTLKFEKGLMIYVQGRGDFLVISPNGAYRTVANPGGGGRATPAASGGYIPGGAYGAAWTASNLQGTLGYATQMSESGFSGTVQQFDNGFILAVNSDVYVFIGSTYQLFG